MGVNGEGTVGMSNFTVEEDNTDGSVDELVRGRTVFGEPTTVVPTSKVLLCADSVVYWNTLVLKGNDASVELCSVTTLGAVLLSFSLVVSIVG